MQDPYVVALFELDSRLLEFDLGLWCTFCICFDRSVLPFAIFCDSFFLFLSNNIISITVLSDKDVHLIL